MRLKRMWVHKHFFQSKIVLDILNKVEDVDKTNKKKKRQIWKRRSWQP